MMVIRMLMNMIAVLVFLRGSCHLLLIYNAETRFGNESTHNSNVASCHSDNAIIAFMVARPKYHGLTADNNDDEMLALRKTSCRSHTHGNMVVAQSTVR